MLANLLLLLVVGFVPFPTALLAATLGTPSAQVGCSCTRDVHGPRGRVQRPLVLARRHGGRCSAAMSSARSIAAISRSYRLGPPGYFLSFLLTLINPVLGLAVLIGLVLLYLLPRPSGG